MERRLLGISDKHSGGKRALMPPEVYDPVEENVFSSNPIQRVLYSKWILMVDHLKEIGGVDVALDNGDQIEGLDRKGKGYEPVTANLKLQCQMAIDLNNMIPFRGPKNWVMTEGSFYHVDSNMGAEEYISTMMMAQGANVTFGPDVLFKLGGVTVHARHHVTVGKSIWMYRATHIAKEALITSICARDWKMDPDQRVDLILRGHAHFFVGVEHERMRGYVLPCWKGRDKFARLRGYDNPHNGYVLFYLDDDTISVEKHIFTLQGEKSITYIDFDKEGSGLKLKRKSTVRSK